MLHDDTLPAEDQQQATRPTPKWNGPRPQYMFPIFRGKRWHTYYRRGGQYVRIEGKPGCKEWWGMYNAIHSLVSSAVDQKDKINTGKISTRRKNNLKKSIDVSTFLEIEKITTPQNFRELPDIVNASISATKSPSIYFLLRNQEVVYVGRSDTPLRRMSNHMHNKEFDSITIMECPKEDVKKLEDYYIKKFCPEYNVSQKPVNDNDSHISYYEIAKTGKSETRPNVRRRAPKRLRPA